MVVECKLGEKVLWEDSHCSRDFMVGFELIGVVVRADYGRGGFEERD